MSGGARRVPAGRGDQVRVTALVDAPVEETFRIFTEEIDQWWRRGRRFRIDPGHHERGVIHLETGCGGRLFESFRTKTGAEKIVQTGQVLVWAPPHRLVLEWRNVNFARTEATEIEVEFAPRSRDRTLVTLTHRGWDAIRPDHPARHGHDVGPFLAELGRWWGDLLASLRRVARGQGEGSPRP